ncbi:hypothetical protein D4A81_02400 [Lachnoanaerobaculum umeaense]|uniref:Uncharacterized protein n=1 Tax=Lachnoanaerobaculum umeaense TaxID=617123 RepID=A0A385PY48_9FIRM|nr:hypothetical protein D4A81_02400 [Lachnoanaerobaculum umeaense]
MGSFNRHQALGIIYSNIKNLNDDYLSLVANKVLELKSEQEYNRATRYVMKHREELWQKRKGVKQ